MKTDYSNNLGLSRSEFLREPVSDPESVLAAGRRSIELTGKVRFAFFWGVSVLKKDTDSFDLETLSFINLTAAKLGMYFKAPVEITLLLGDTHATSNFINEEHYESYLSEVECLANQFGMKTIYLSTFFSDLELAKAYSLTEIEKSIYDEKKKSLMKSAMNIGPIKTASERTKRYLAIRLKEIVAIKKNLPSFILMAADRPSNQYLLPDLPTIFIYARGKRRNAKPWFLTKETTSTCVE